MVGAGWSMRVWLAVLPQVALSLFHDVHAWTTVLHSPLALGDAGSDVCTSLLPSQVVAAVDALGTTAAQDEAATTGTTVASARTLTFFWFFGSSGASAIGASAYPGMLRNAALVRSLGAEGADAIRGAETLGLNLFLTGYPRDVAVADVTRVVGNPLSVESIVERYPVADNYLASRGYLTYEAFTKANAAANPLATRAVFDCFAQGTNTVKPDVAQAKLDRYKADLGAIRGDLLRAKLTGIAALFILVALLGYADVEAAVNAYKGWFPDWPGGRLWLEGGLWDPDIGITHIPEYWIS